MTTERNDTWAAGNLYEPYVGRWSRLVAGIPRVGGSIDLIARAWAVRGRTA